MAKIRLLLADEHAMLRDGLRALFKLYDDLEIVGEASNGEEVMARARELAPDVIVTDIALPGTDGIEATRRILQDNPRIKILTLTHYESREHILAIIKAGATGYITKKARGSELVTAIRTVFEGHSFLYPPADSVLIDDYRQQSQGNDVLTAREREILNLMVQGRGSREIATMLVISPKTVLGHRARIMEKLGLHNRTELIKYIMRHGLVVMETLNP